MTAIPNDPMAPIAAASSGNRDLPATAYPALIRIQPTELVGPESANRQHASLEKRTETLRLQLNRLAAALNAIDLIFLRKDGSTSKDGTTGVLADLPMGGHRVTGVGTPVDEQDAVRMLEINAVYAAMSRFNGTPAGMISGFAANLPAGWLGCDGSVYRHDNITLSTGVVHDYPSGFTWADLALLRAYMADSSYPWGGDDNTLRVPDFRGRVIIGSGIGSIGSILRVDVTNQGAYTVAPTVAFSAPPAGGVQATGAVVFSNGKVTSVTITNPGRGYITPPSVAFTGANTTLAVATAVLALSPRLVGVYGGEEVHLLTVPEMPSHIHPIGTSWGGYDRNWVVFGNAGDVPSVGTGPVKSAGGDAAHNNMPPFAVATVGIKF